MYAHVLQFAFFFENRSSNPWGLLLGNKILPSSRYKHFLLLSNCCYGIKSKSGGKSGFLARVAKYQ